MRIDIEIRSFLSVTSSIYMSYVFIFYSLALIFTTLQFCALQTHQSLSLCKINERYLITLHWMVSLPEWFYSVLSITFLWCQYVVFSFHDNVVRITHCATDNRVRLRVHLNKIKLNVMTKKQLYILIYHNMIFY